MERKQISFDGVIKQTTVISFDESHVYIEDDGDEKAVAFADVLTLSRTSNAVNNRYFWLLEYRIDEATEVEKFRTNATLWNRNFRQFHARLSKAKPAAVTSPYRWWDL